jgi:thymidylate synthase (FAD)
MIKVLDHGFVRLVESMGSDLSVVRNARVSYDAAPRKDGSDEKLIRYLWKNHHTSPFEAVSFTFDISCPIFVARQWMRHRTWSFNEISARYSKLHEKYYVPLSNSITTQSESNKQMRTTQAHPKADDIRAQIDGANRAAFLVYYSLINEGVPRELARTVLPVSTYTHFFGTVNLSNLFKFIVLRDHEHAQPEIQDYAKALLHLIEPIVPVCCQVFKEGR